MNTLGQAIIVAGSVLALLSGIGVLRLSDVLARMHALSKASTLGFVLVMTGAAACVSRTGAMMLLLAAALQCFTIPVGSNMISRATYRERAGRGELEPIDELADDERARAELGD